MEQHTESVNFLDSPYPRGFFSKWQNLLYTQQNEVKGWNLPNSVLQKTKDSFNVKDKERGTWKKKLQLRFQLFLYLKVTSKKCEVRMYPAEG